MVGFGWLGWVWLLVRVEALHLQQGGRVRVRFRFNQHVRLHHVGRWGLLADYPRSIQVLRNSEVLAYFENYISKETLQGLLTHTVNGYHNRTTLARRECYVSTVF